MSNDKALLQRLTERIKATPAPPTTTSKAALFRDLLPAIEEAMTREVRQADLVAALAAEGLVMSVDELRNALYRERKRQKKRSANAPGQTTPTPPAKAPAAPQPQQPRGDFRLQRDNPLKW